MKYDLMLIGPATRDINIDYTGQEVREIGGAVFFCAYAAAAASANLFASVKIHPDDTDVLDAFHLDSDHIAVLPPMHHLTRRHLLHRRPRTPQGRMPGTVGCNHSRSDPRCGLWPVSSGRSAVRRFPQRADPRAFQKRQGIRRYSGISPTQRKRPDELPRLER